MIFDTILTAVGLAMDASAVSMTNGMNEKPLKVKKALLIALFFGIFQAVMPLIGYYSGSLFKEYIESIDHYVALILLSIIGISMIIEGKKNKLEETKELSIKRLILQAIATSIDAFAVGISFAALGVNIYIAILIIGLVTFVLSFVSCYIGKKFGELLKNKAQFVGGIILIGIGLKIFIEHMWLQ